MISSAYTDEPVAGQPATLTDQPIGVRRSSRSSAVVHKPYGIALTILEGWGMAANQISDLTEGEGGLAAIQWNDDSSRKLESTLR